MRTEAFAETVAFFRHVLGVPLVELAPDELEAAGIEVFGPIQGTADQAWIHFRGPDGNVYGLTDGASYHRPT